MVHPRFFTTTIGLLHEFPPFHKTFFSKTVFLYLIKCYILSEIPYSVLQNKGHRFFFHIIFSRFSEPSNGLSSQ